jgi:cobyrinic acid a,c-diamide synthase
MLNLQNRLAAREQVRNKEQNIMKTTRSCVIEFVGGPFDGHVQYVSLQPSELMELVTLPVNENVLRLVNGEPIGQRAAATSLATYERDLDLQSPRYYFLGSIPADQLALQNWRF